MSGTIFLVAFLVCILGARMAIVLSQYKIALIAIIAFSCSLAFFLLLQTGSFEKAAFTVIALQGLAFGLVVSVMGLKNSKRKV